MDACCVLTGTGVLYWIVCWFVLLLLPLSYFVVVVGVDRVHVYLFFVSSAYVCCVRITLMAGQVPGRDLPPGEQRASAGVARQSPGLLPGSVTSFRGFSLEPSQGVGPPGIRPREPSPRRLARWHRYP